MADLSFISFGRLIVFLAIPKQTCFFTLILTKKLSETYLSAKKQRLVIVRFQVLCVHGVCVVVLLGRHFTAISLVGCRLGLAHNASVVLVNPKRI